MPATRSTEYFNQGVTWNTSKDGQNHTDPGPSPGSYNQPSHTPDSGYSNNTPGANPINAPGGNDYGQWNWEQVLNGVLGLKLPDRSLISGSRWTVTDAQSDSSLFQIFGFTGHIFLSRNSSYISILPYSARPGHGTSITTRQLQRPGRGGLL